MRKILGVAIVLYIGFFAALWAGRLNLIYPFDPTYVPLSETSLQNFKEKRLRTPDGETLVIWVAKPRKSAPVFIYFSGNAGNLANRAKRFERLHSWGFGIVALGYRGSSGSSGTPGEDVITEDALQVRQALPELLGNKARGPVIYYGESLGTGVATKLAGKRAPDGLILEAPYTSVAELAAQRMPMFPVASVLEEVWDSKAHIKKVKTPLLVIHGTDDDVIPFSMGQTIFNTSPARNKKMHIVKGGGHSNLWTSNTQRAILKFANQF